MTTLVPECVVTKRETQLQITKKLYLNSFVLFVLGFFFRILKEQGNNIFHAKFSLKNVHIQIYSRVLFHNGKSERFSLYVVQI